MQNRRKIPTTRETSDKGDQYCVGMRIGPDPAKPYGRPVKDDTHIPPAVLLSVAPDRPTPELYGRCKF